MATSFNILGICVLRDIFSHHPNDGGYKINQYVNSFPPLFIHENGISVDIDRYNKTDTSDIVSNFIKRSILFNVNRTVFDYVESKKSDYILIDMGLARVDYYILENGQYCFGGYRSLYDRMSSKGLFPKIIQAKPFNFLSTAEIKERTIAYCKKIKSLYDINKIILFEIKNSTLLYDSKKESISSFDPAAVRKAYLQNEFIEFCFSVARKELQGCHVVYMPKNVVCDAYHPLKKGLLHFTQEYYDYGLESINIITKNMPRDEEEKALNALRKDTEELYAKKYFSALEKSIISAAKANKIIKRKNVLFEKLYSFLSDVYKDNIDISDFLTAKNINAIIIYGYNDAYTCIRKQCLQQKINVIGFFDAKYKADHNDKVAELSNISKEAVVLIIDFVDENIIYKKLINLGFDAYKLTEIIDWLYKNKSE